MALYISCDPYFSYVCVYIHVCVYICVYIYVCVYIIGNLLSREAAGIEPRGCFPSIYKEHAGTNWYSSLLFVVVVVLLVVVVLIVVAYCSRHHAS